MNPGRETKLTNPSAARRPRSLPAPIAGAGWLSGALLLGVGLAVVSWQAGVLDIAGFDQLNDTLTAGSGGTASLVAVLAAFGIGASMIVLPCGFPSVFVVPSVLTSRKRLDQRVVLALLFLSGSALLLAAAGVVLGFAGAGILDLLSTDRAKMTLAVGVFSFLGLLSVGYGLSELGYLRLPSLQARLSGPDLPPEEKPYQRSLVLGATFGGGLGIGCPMPTYYVILGWVVAAANPLYGAVLMASYGLGRVAPALAIGGLITAGASRAVVSRRLALVRERTAAPTGLLLVALGAYLMILFGVVLGLRVF